MTRLVDEIGQEFASSFSNHHRWLGYLVRHTKAQVSAICTPLTLIRLKIPTAYLARLFETFTLNFRAFKVAHGKAASMEINLALFALLFGGFLTFFWGC